MPRRILVLNERDPANPLAGGAEVHIFEIFKRLVERGHAVTVLTASFRGSSREQTIDGVRVVRLANRYLYYGIVALAARREARRGYDLVVDVLNKLPFLSPWTVPLPCFCIVHHLFGTTAFRQVSLPIAVVTYLAELLIPRAYRGVPMLAISPSTKEDLVLRGLEGEHIHVVAPGLDHRLYSAPTAEVADEGRSPVVAWIGRLEPYKRADVVIDALVSVRARVPDATLVIMGAGSSRPALEARATERGLDDAVTFTGYVPEADKIELLRRAAVVVQTSEKEGWGMTVIEGNACGAPSLATRVPGLQDSVRDGSSGLLVPYGEVEPVASALARLLTDHALWRQLAEGGRAWAARFTWENVASDTESLIEEAIAPTGIPPPLAASPF